MEDQSRGPIVFPPGVPHQDDRYRFIVENAEEGVAGLSADLRISYANQKFSSLHGYLTQELIGRSFVDLAGTSWQEEIKATLEAVRCGGSQQREVMNRRKDASEFWVSLTARPINRAGEDLAYICLITDLTGRKSAEEKLQRTNRELRRLSLELLHTQDAERRRIARELHDSTSPLLTGIILNLARMDFQNPESVRDLVPETAALTQQCFAEIRSISYLLHPPMLDELGLAAAIKMFSRGFQQRTGLKVDFEVSHFQRLDPACELALFRIVQEALSNVHRHSGSPSVQINLAEDGGTIRLTVEDYGRGFPAMDSAASSGVGILSMRERAQLLGGRLDIQSVPGKTIIAVSLPMEKVQ